jgi:hypothetical protein
MCSTPTHKARRAMTALSPFREQLDFYPTPSHGTRALLSVERFDGSIWEPCCGDGAISRVLSSAGYYVVSTDLIDRGYGTGGINFLTETTARAKHIITNPPYGRGMADHFVRHALRLTAPTGGSVAMLLDLAGLAHPLRHGLFVSNPPANVYILDELVCWPANRANAFPAANRFAWLIWKPGHQGRSQLWWLSTARFKTPDTWRGTP